MGIGAGEGVGHISVLTKAVSIRDICFIKAVLLSLKHGHSLQNFASHG